MPPKRDNRFAKNWAPPEKEWFRPQLTPEELARYRREIEQEGGDYSLVRRHRQTVSGAAPGRKSDSPRDGNRRRNLA